MFSNEEYVEKRNCCPVCQSSEVLLDLSETMEELKARVVSEDNPVLSMSCGSCLSAWLKELKVTGYTLTYDGVRDMDTADLIDDENLGDE